MVHGVNSLEAANGWADVQFIILPLYTFTGPKFMLSLDAGRPWTVQCADPRDNPGRDASVQEETQLNLDDQC